MDDGYQSGSLFPSWNMADNRSGISRQSFYQCRYSGSYVDMLDLSGRAKDDIIHQNTSSIIVRYMPNLWARITHGDLDRYKAVFYQFSRVAERELTQIFLEKLTGKYIEIRHPQGSV